MGGGGGLATPNIRAGYQFYNCNIIIIEKTKENKKEAGVGPF